MFMNFQRFRTVFVVIIILAITLAFFGFLKNRDNRVDCVSTFYTVPNDGVWEYLKGTMSVTFSSNGQGNVMFSGEARKIAETGKLYSFERFMHFSFDKTDQKNFALSKVNVAKYKGDDLDDAVFTKYIYSHTSEQTDHLVVVKLNNGYLIGNMVGPRHLCVKR